MNAIRTLMAAAAAALSLSSAALAHGTEDHPEGIHIHDAYARTMGGVGASGAVFFVIHNNTDHDVTITGASTDVAQKAELHTHKEDANGVMQMMPIEGGVPVPYGEMHEFKRGADHVMLMGLTKELKDGDTVTITLTFDGADPVTFDAVVDNARKADAAGMDGMQGMDGMEGMDHSKMGHSTSP